MTRSPSLLASILLHGAIVAAVALWVPTKWGGMPGEGGATAEFNAQLLDDSSEASPADDAVATDTPPDFSVESDPEPEIQRVVDLPSPPVITSDVLAGVAAPAVGIQDLELTKPVTKSSRPPGRARRSNAGLAGSRAGGGGGNGNYAPPRYARCPAPNYPPEARAAHQSGLTLLRVSIDANGAVVRVSLSRSSGSRALDIAALATVRTWRFVPAQLDKTPVAAEVEVPVRFVL